MARTNRTKSSMLHVANFSTTNIAIARTNWIEFVARNNDRHRRYNSRVKVESKLNKANARTFSEKSPTIRILTFVRQPRTLAALGPPSDTIFRPRPTEVYSLLGNKLGRRRRAAFVFKDPSSFQEEDRRRR